MVDRIENLVTINGVINGSFFPASKNRLLTDVVLQEGFHIRGGIYANQLTIEGPGIVEGPVMAKKDIMIYPPTDLKKRIILRCGLSARLSISVNVPNTFGITPVSHKGFLPLFIRGDIISDSVNIENTVVIGNVFARNAAIKDSIIIGCPLIEDKLTMRNSMAISFRAGSVELINRNSIWVPYGLVNTNIEFARYITDQEDNVQKKELETEAGETPAEDANIAWLRYIALCRTKEHGCGKSSWFYCQKHLKGTCTKTDVRITSADIVNVKRGEKNFRAITIAPRLVDLSRVQKDLEEMVGLLTKALYYEHFNSASQQIIKTELESKRNEANILPPHYQFLEEVINLNQIN